MHCSSEGGVAKLGESCKELAQGPAYAFWSPTKVRKQKAIP